MLVKSNYFRKYAIESATGTTIDNVSLRTMINFVIPLPLLSEQHRIVSKVDELFGICDALKEKIGAAQVVQLHLADALTLSAVEDPKRVIRSRSGGRRPQKGN